MDSQQVRVQLNNSERGYYSSLLSQLDPQNCSKITGKTAVSFMKKSGLTIEQLKSIWRMSTNNPDTLYKEEFYLALRLIALL